MTVLSPLCCVSKAVLNSSLPLPHSEMNIQDLVLMEIILELGKNGKEKGLCQFSPQCMSLACDQAAFPARSGLCHCVPPSVSTTCTSMSIEPFVYVLA